MNRKAFQSLAYCFINVGCISCFTSVRTRSFMLLQLSWIRYYLNIKATSVASTVVFQDLFTYSRSALTVNSQREFSQRHNSFVIPGTDTSDCSVCSIKQLPK